MFVPSAILESGGTLSRGDHLGHATFHNSRRLTEADVDTIERLLPLAKDAALRARLADILWLRRTSAHQAAKASIDDYITAAQNLLQPQSWGILGGNVASCAPTRRQVGTEESRVSKSGSCAYRGSRTSLGANRAVFRQSFSSPDFGVGSR